MRRGWPVFRPREGGAHVDGRIVQVADAVRPVESGTLGLADGRHDLLLVAHSVPDDVGNHPPVDHCRGYHLQGEKKHGGDIRRSPRCESKSEIIHIEIE